MNNNNKLTMWSTKNKKISELQTVMSKLPLELCCQSLLPEFGVPWREADRAIRKARLPMTSSSIARVVCKVVAQNMPEEVVDEIILRLRLKVVATQNREWHVINLVNPIVEEPLEPEELRERLTQTLKSVRIVRNRSLKVETVELGSLLFASIQSYSGNRATMPLYVAFSPGIKMALTNSLRATGLLKAFVRGLGYESYEDASLHGRDVLSLLRIHAGHSKNVDFLTDTPVYEPIPVLTSSGIDYTNQTYDKDYVDSILGQNTPHLTHLTITTSEMFFDNKWLNTPMKMTYQLKSEDIAKTLKCYVINGALVPDSKFFHVFHVTKSNNINYGEAE